MSDEELFAEYFREEEVARLLGITVKTLRNRHVMKKNHPPKTPEGLYPKDEFYKWNQKRLQHQINRAS